MGSFVQIIQILGLIVSLLSKLPQLRGFLKDFKDIISTANKSAVAMQVAKDPMTPVKMSEVREVVQAQKSQMDTLIESKDFLSIKTPSAPAGGPTADDEWIQADPQKGIKEGHWKSSEALS